MSNPVNVCIRYAENLPILRYIIPFSYSQNGMTYDDAKKKILATKEWNIGKRKDLVPSKEEDLYDHVYNSFIDDGMTSMSDTNIGMFFIPKKQKAQPFVYSFYDNNHEKKYDFLISDVNIFIFKTGIGLYVYEAFLPQHSKVEEGYIKSLDINQLVLFQNRFKELNVVRGYFGKEDDRYSFYPKGHNSYEFYTLGREIAQKLNRTLGNVFYYPPRVNIILKHKKLHELKQQKLEAEKKGEFNKKKYNKEKTFWEDITISDFDKLTTTEKEDIFIVPDKALLYSYVVMNTSHNLLEESEKEKAFSQFCTHLYYLTRGYKPSYKVSHDANNERKQMFQRHENDFWDAALEGVGDFVLLYENLYENNLNSNEENNLQQKNNLFFDNIRPKEMRGDYFILYILLLYQHYSVVFFSKKISQTIPMQKEVFLSETQAGESVYTKLSNLKLDIDMFFANCMFESVGQITDVCTIYSFIEGKLHVKKNMESLQRGIHDLNSLREEIQNKQQSQKEARTNKILSIIGILAIISIIFDSIQFLTWISENILPLISPVWNYIVFTVPKKILFLFLLFTVVFILIIIKRCIYKKTKTKKKRD